MPFSSTTSFNLTQSQICTRAAAKLKLVDTGLGEQISTSMQTDFAQQLNVIIKEAMSLGIKLWTRSFNTLFLQQGQVTYSLGPTTTDHWTINYSDTTLTVAGVATDTTITVSSTTGITDTYNIGIHMDDGTLFWTTVNGAPVGSVVTLTDALPSGTSIGNHVYCYQTTADRPQHILEIYRSNTSNVDTIMDFISAQVYSQLPNKIQTGTPLQATYENTLPNATLKIWQPSNGTSGYDRLTILIEDIIYDLTATTDNAYFPVEWVNYLIFRLAADMAYEYDIPDTRIQMLEAKADKKLQDLVDYNSTQSESPIQFGMRNDSGGF
jgi:hypothetical protein